MKKIGEIMVENKLISKKDLDDALEIQSRGLTSKRIGEILIDMGAISYDTLLDYLDKQLTT